jgi:dTDP-4-amino-4,6-dideoxygalactose transaminase
MDRAAGTHGRRLRGRRGRALRSQARGGAVVGHGRAAPGAAGGRRRAGHGRGGADDDLRGHGERRRLHGAEPFFVDCGEETGNLDPDLLEQALKQLDADGAAVAAVVPVDLLGRCADYPRLLAVCSAFAVPVVSDAAESLGSSLAGRPAGSFGTTAALSFNGNKVMTTSGGGMLLTDDAATAERVRYLSTQARQPAVHYEHTEVGYNYRLSNVLAALGLAQLERLDEMIGRRRTLREKYARLFAGRPGVRVFQRPGDDGDNCWLTAVVVDAAVAGWSAGDLRAALDAADVESRPLWKPMHSQPVFAGARSLLTGSADRLFATGLTLPSGSALGPAQVDAVRTTVRAFLEAR